MLRGLDDADARRSWAVDTDGPDYPEAEPGGGSLPLAFLIGSIEFS
jgi:hypothetical protein